MLCSLQSYLSSSDALCQEEQGCGNSQCDWVAENLYFGQPKALICGSVPTRQDLQSSGRTLVEVFSEIVRNEEIMHIALIGQEAVTVRPNRRVQMVLDLETLDLVY